MSSLVFSNVICLINGPNRIIFLATFKRFKYTLFIRIILSSFFNSFLFLGLNLYISSIISKSKPISLIFLTNKLSLLSGTKIKIFFSSILSSPFMQILYFSPNLSYIFFNNSFIKANVGTIKTMLVKFGCLIIYSITIKVFPKLVGALKNKLFSSNILNISI